MKREEKQPGMPENSTPPEDTMLVTSHTLAVIDADMEKVFYAVKGLIIDLDRIQDKCADKDCRQCTEDACEDHRRELLSVFLDSRAKYNLSDSEFIEAYIMAYDRTIGLPAQPIEADKIREQGGLDVSEAFGVDENELWHRIANDYMRNGGADDVMQMITDPQSLGNRLVGIDRAVEVAINESGIGYRELTAYLLSYIQRSSGVIADLQDEIRRLKEKKRE